MTVGPYMEFQELFKLGMKRNIPAIIKYTDGKVINLGSSPGDVWRIPGADALGKPDWRFPAKPLPYDDASITTIHCYHFLEHLWGPDAISMLRECERVMVPNRSVLNFCMPYYNSNLQAECLDHKSIWNENTFRNLFENSGFDIAGDWKLKTHFILIAGVVERNLCVIGQIVRGL